MLFFWDRRPQVPSAVLATAGGCAMRLSRIRGI